MTLTTTRRLDARAGGILLHPTSLPSRFGIGDLGQEAHRFVDWLAEAGIGWWQMLPVGPVGRAFSPYDSPSVFAGGPHLISPERLAVRGLLLPAELERAAAGAEAGDGVDYRRALGDKLPLLRLAHQRFSARPRTADQLLLEEWAERERDWLDDHALFAAVARKLERGRLLDWDRSLRARQPAALSRARKALAAEVDFEVFLQFEFDRQWRDLRARAAAKGVALLGDVPIYVARDGADVWARPEIFDVDPAGRLRAVAGVPPDYFNRKGQLWGNPLYRWDALAATGYEFWVRRLRHQLARFDALRLDHFIGFVRYYAVKAGAKDARKGIWNAGPGRRLFQAVARALGPVELLAEDLGAVTQEVRDLRSQLELPGMRVLQFAFGGGPNEHLPHNYPRRTAVYTGTHDNDTALGWLETRSSSAAGHRERARALRYLGSDGKEFHWDLIRLAFASVADLAVAPAQDVLGLGSSGRMNVPGRARGNWRWRLRAGELGSTHARRLRELAQTFGRATALEPGA